MRDAGTCFIFSLLAALFPSDVLYRVRTRLQANSFISSDTFFRGAYVSYIKPVTYIKYQLLCLL
jgi:hypothetical protein